MVKPTTVYICEKCGYYDFNKHKAIMHEKKPIIEVCNSLDGLIVQFYKSISVFRRGDGYSVNSEHKALYIWENYIGKNLDKENSVLGKKLEEQMKQLVSHFTTAGFTADYIKGSVLYDGRSENIYKEYDDLSEKEFNRCSKILKKRYPELYKGIEFKRTIEIGRRFKG